MISNAVQCSEAKGYKALIFFMALYLVAIGSGCLKPNIISLGADQFSNEDTKQSKKLSTYFNCAYFAFSVGELVALTLLVWVQTHSGMDIGFGVSAVVMAVGLISLISGTFLYRNKRPQGSIFTPIAQVCNHINTLFQSLFLPLVLVLYCSNLIAFSFYKDFLIFVRNGHHMILYTSTSSLFLNVNFPQKAFHKKLGLQLYNITHGTTCTVNSDYYIFAPIFLIIIFFS